MEPLIRTLTLTSAWRLLILIAGFSFLLGSPGLQPAVFAADTTTGSIVGIVVVETSNGPKPVGNVDVRLTFGSKSDARTSGADGKFQFAGLLPGRYTVRITPPDGLKAKGDGTANVTVSAGDTERADFGLIAEAAPTPTPTPAAKATPASSPKPADSVSSVAAAAAAAAAQAVPQLVAPFATPAGSTQPSAAQPSVTPARTSQPAALGIALPAAASPGPALFGTPGMMIAAASPTPDPSAVGTVTPTPGGDVLASGPPRRLITSFEALRQTAGGGTGATAQLKSWATDTSLVLGVPFKTQIDGTSFSLVNCGPASLTMVLVAFGLEVDPPSVRDYLNHLVGNFDTEAGTSLYVLARIAREAGLTTFGSAAGLQGWSVEAIREHVRAGHPVITLTKYRFLPGHFGSVTDFDHYIVITGLAGEDFVYNDAAYSTEYGYNLLISPAQLERAWAASSVPRHAVAVGFGDSLKPLPIVPRGLTAESLAALPPGPDVNAMVPEAPVRINRGPAAEWLREQMLDKLGARTAVLSGPQLDEAMRLVPPTRLDPSDAAILERPAGSAVADPSVWATVAAEEADGAVLDGDAPSAESVADARPAARSADGEPVAALAPAGRPGAGAPISDESHWLPSSLSPLGIALMSVGLVLATAGRLAGRRRSEIRAWLPQLPRFLRRRR